LYLNIKWYNFRFIWINRFISQFCWEYTLWLVWWWSRERIWIYNLLSC